jgi:hypothetical protein
VTIQRLREIRRLCCRLSFGVLSTKNRKDQIWVQSKIQSLQPHPIEKWDFLSASCQGAVVLRFMVSKARMCLGRFGGLWDGHLNGCGLP